MTPQTRLLSAQDALPVFQNRMHDSAAEGRDCPKGDSPLVKREYFSPSLGMRGEGLRDAAPGATIIVMNPSYPKQIREMTENAFTYVGVSA